MVSKKTIDIETIACEMKGITKEFFGVKANDNIDLSVNKGEIHALLGENGAGKSTLMKILSGIYTADSGEIYLNGKLVEINSPRNAFDHGIGMVHQHFSLVDVFKVNENIILGEKSRDIWINEKKINNEIIKIGEKYEIAINPNSNVWQLSLGEQQRVEILKLLMRGVEILIFDEPTSVLTPQEVDGFFNTLRKLSKEGKSIIIITHKLNEVFNIAQRVTILRKGKKISSVYPEDVTKKDLAKMMVGKEVIFDVKKPKVQSGKSALVLKDISAKNDRGILALKTINLEVKASEIVGVAGVSGNGQTELAEVISGLRTPISGEIIINGEEVKKYSTQSAIKSGVSHIPEDRIGTGLIPQLSVKSNLVLKDYKKKKFSKGFLLNLKAISNNAKELIDVYNIDPKNPDSPIMLLSGGNQQKVVLAREITTDHNILVAMHPTFGLDVAATEFVRNKLIDHCKEGGAILLISEDLDEILQLSDRISVIFQGEIQDTISSEEADIENIGLMMAGEKPNHFSK